MTKAEDQGVRKGRTARASPERTARQNGPIAKGHADGSDRPQPYNLKGLCVTLSAPVEVARRKNLRLSDLSEDTNGEFLWYPQVARLPNGELLAQIRLGGDTVLAFRLGSPPRQDCAYGTNIESGTKSGAGHLAASTRSEASVPGTAVSPPSRFLLDKSRV